LSGDFEERERAHEREMVAHKRNTARFFTEHPQVAWVALIFTIFWGIYGYLKMPKAKDPLIEVRVAVASCVWPGAEARKVEELVTRKMEQKLSENSSIERIESISRTSVAIAYVVLKEDVSDRKKEWDDIQGRLSTIRDLPQGAGPIQFQKDFGDTATLMLTVTSPMVSDIELELRAKALSRTLESVRQGTTGERAALIVGFPPGINPSSLERLGSGVASYFEQMPDVKDARLVRAPGFLGVDVETAVGDEELRGRLVAFAQTHLRVSELHPDVWPAAVIRDGTKTAERLREVAREKYSYHELDLYTDLIKRYLQALPIVSKVSRSGVLPEQIYLEYSQERLASYGVQPSKLSEVLAARNITAPGGVLEVGGKNVSIAPSGELAGEDEIGSVVTAFSSDGSPVYLRDLVEVNRDYQSPARFLNYIYAKNPDGSFTRSRAITLAINMRPGAQIADFAEQVDAQLEVVEKLLPEDLKIHRTSDQPLQVRENVDLFMTSLYEAIALVVLVALLGFWEWRMALLLALSIPITLAMTFGMMFACGIDIQQISIASLIIALGLLIDDPVVAADAIKHSLAVGWKPKIAAWLGPTKLATAILFATVTNIAAYLPFLSITDDTGKFIFSLPIVLTLSLVASRIVSMTFVPMLGATLLRATKEPTAAERRQSGFGKVYTKIAGACIDHRKLSFAVSVLLLAGAAYFGVRAKQAFFPKDLSYLSYVDIWLPEDAPLSATQAIAVEAEEVIREAAADYARLHPEQGDVLESITEFVGGGAPRFWFSVEPELQQLNYAQLMVRVRNKEQTRSLVPFLQERLSRRVAGARIDVRELETGKPVGIPVSVRISGENIDQLRKLAEEAKEILRATPGAERVRDDWGSDTFEVRLEVDPDRANLAGVTNLDVAISSAAAMNGFPVGELREGDRQIPIVARLRAQERAQIADVRNLYITSLQSDRKVPLGQVSRVAYSLETEKIRRRNQFRTITVAAFPAAGLLPSEVFSLAAPRLRELSESLPPGYKLEIAGEAEEQVKSFGNLVVVLILVLVAIYLALVLQFRHAIKPFVVFAALPYGVVAALVSLVVMDAPFSFMAFLGIISLLGVIVSHIILLFDFIEESREQGATMRDALINAGLMRIRPVLITVIATVLGLVPLALHGGPLWQPLCYAQIGGLTFATLITLVLVPMLYSITIQDLGWIKWEAHSNAETDPPPGAPPEVAELRSAH
jgi:multidrug efflux pump subunit AcrB